MYKFLILTFITLLLFACNSGKVEERKQFSDNNNSEVVDLSNESELFTLVPSSVTNINFTNRIEENQNFNFKSYAYIYNGGGVAIGDINNDGLQDVFLGGNLVSGRLFLNLGDFKFKDITDESGLNNARGFRTGVNMVDVNNDGFVDIYICAGGLYMDDFRKNLLYINNGNNTFTEQAEKFGLADMSFSTQSFFFDMDNDGDVDLYLLNHPSSPKESNNLRLENDANGKLKIALSSDLKFISDRLYRNDNGKFVDITEKAGILNDAFGLSAVVADFNDDQFTDIYVCNDYVKPDNLYINNGDGTFTDQFNTYFQHTSFSSMGSDYSDINNDGCMDLMTLDMYPEDNERQKMHGTEYNYDKYLLTKKMNLATQFIKNTLQINNCNGTYSDIAMLSDLAHTDWSWTTLFADYNNDGWKDIFVTNGYRRSVSDNDYVRYTQDSFLKKVDKSNITIEGVISTIPVHKTKSFLYKNNGNLSFSNVSDIWNAGPPEFSNGAVYVDLDNDGYLDLITNNIDESPFIYKNNGATTRKNNFIRFDLEYEKGKTRLGTKVEIIDDKGNFQSQYFYQSRGFLSSVEPIVHFGLGKVTNVKEVKVYWPNGKVQIVTDFKVNKLNKIVYNSSSEMRTKLINPNVFFEDISGKLNGIAHVENEFIDFKREPLLHRKYSDEGPASAVGDVNGDGLEDFYLGGCTGNTGRIYLQNSNGSFSPKDSKDFGTDIIFEDVAAAFADVNKDGSLDLIVISGGNEFSLNSPNYEDRLYINDGKGGFTKKQNGMPKIFSSGSNIALNDIDGDGDLDIFVGGRVSSGMYPESPMSYLAKNENGVFINVTPEWSNGLFKAGMITSSVFADLNKDGKSELILSGEWMPISIFSFTAGKFENVTESFGISKYLGWWEKVYVKDLNNDGYPEIIAGNAGLNTHMKASFEKPITLHYKDYDGNKTIDPIICYYNGDKSYPIAMRDRLLDHMIVLKKKFLRYKPYSNATIEDIFTPEQRKGESVLSANTLANMIFYNQNGKSFVPKKMPITTQISCIRTILDVDLNNDSYPDIITGGNFFGTEVLLGRYDSSIGNTLINDGKGNFKDYSAAYTGLNIGGDVRNILPIKSKEGLNLLVIKNNDKISLLKIKKGEVN